MVMKTIIIIFIFSLFSLSIFAQEEKYPIAVDSFLQPPCEDVVERMDNFMINLTRKENSTAKGYIYIYGQPRAIRKADYQLRNWFKIRKADEALSKRVVFVKIGEGGRRAAIDFWLVPAGVSPATIPMREDIEIEAVSEAISEPPKKEYLFSSHRNHGIVDCTDAYPEFYAESLKANEKSRGRILIYSSTNEGFQFEKKRIEQILKKACVDKKKFQIKFIKVKPQVFAEKIEFFITP